VQRRSRPSGRAKNKDGKEFIESQRTKDNRQQEEVCSEEKMEMQIMKGNGNYNK